MKVCVLAPENSPSWGGVGTYVYNLIKHLPSDFEKHIVTINRNVPDSYDNLLQDENCHLHPILHVKNDDSFFYNFRFQLAVLKKLRGLHKEHKFDIIHSHSGHLPHLFSQFQNLAPLVVTVHSTSTGMNLNIKNYKTEKSETETYMGFFLQYIRFCEKIGFRKADKLLPISKFTLDEIINLYHIDITNKSIVVHNATDPDMFRPVEVDHKKETVITFIGRFYAIKGFQTYLEALKNIIKKGHKIRPYLVGRGKTESVNEILKSYSSHYLLQDITPYNEMPKVYDYSDIVIVPSLYENCPSVVLEAMSSGKIIIASSVGAIPEIVQHEKNGFLFEKGNVIDLERKITAVLENTYDTDKIRKNARETILKRYQWSEKAKEIRHIYKTMVQ